MDISNICVEDQVFVFGEMNSDKNQTSNSILQVKPLTSQNR